MPRKSSPALPAAAALAAEIKALRRVGVRMANWCFMLSLNTKLSEQERTALLRLREDWYAIPRSAVDGRKGPK